MAEFVDALDREGWSELGGEIDGGPMGAPAYHPRSLLSVWLYGFMTGVRSCRKLEAACRDQIPYLWLTGWQHPDHNTLWRFYKEHRQAMRSLFKRTVRTAVTMKLVDLAIQAVDGTKVGANASDDRTHDTEGLRRILDRVERAISDLEAQNEGGEDSAAVHLPEELADKTALRDQVRQAMDDLAGQERPRRINLTDNDARVMKTRQGFAPGYNAQAMVSPVEPDGGMTGMLVTAVDVVDEPNDYYRLAPMVIQAEETTGTKAPMTLADAGYFTGSHLEECARRGQRVVVPDPQQKLLRQQPYRKDLFTYDERKRLLLLPTGTDPALRQKQAHERDDDTDVPGLWVRLPRVPGLRSLYEGWHLWPSLGGRASRRSAAPSSRLDGDSGSQTSVWVEKAVGRTGLRNHQGATGCSEVPVAWPCQREGRMDGASHRPSTCAPSGRRGAPGSAFPFNYPKAWNPTPFSDLNRDQGNNPPPLIP